MIEKLNANENNYYYIELRDDPSSTSKYFYN